VLPLLAMLYTVILVVGLRCLRPQHRVSSNFTISLTLA